jgi:hypothetical protein
MLKILQNTLLWRAGESGHNVWLTEEFLFSLKWVIKFSLKWVASCRSYVRFISLCCPIFRRKIGMILNLDTFF